MYGRICCRIVHSISRDKKQTTNEHCTRTHTRTHTQTTMHASVVLPDSVEAVGAPTPVNAVHPEKLVPSREVLPRVPLHPTVWGPAYWQVLHTIAHIYPDHPSAVLKDQYIHFYHNLPLFVPDVQIATRVAHLLRLCPVEPYLTNRDALCRWTHYFHNRVNELLGRDTVTAQVAYDQFARPHIEAEHAAQRARSLHWRDIGRWAGVVGAVAALLVLWIAVHSFWRHQILI